MIAKTAKLKIKYKIVIFCNVFLLLLKAAYIRNFTQNRRLKLPPINHNDKYHTQEIENIRLWIEKVIKVLMFWKSARCFYRSYTLACLLREKGMIIILNIGLDEFLRSGSPAKAHCWLTYNNQIYNESENVCFRFPNKIGECVGGIQYWIGEA